jgi:AcrR family transcriptional regulator
MARPQATDYGDKRNLIAAQAAAIFARQGAANASLAEVANACNMSKSLIYHYYASKEDLLFDVMDRHMSDLISIISTAAAPTAAPPTAATPTGRGETAFQIFTRRLMDHYVGAGDSQKVLLYELENIPAENRAKIVAKQRQLIAHAENLLAAALPGTSLEKSELKVRIMLYFGMLNWSHSWFRADGAISRRQIADLAADATLKGVLPDPMQKVTSAAR